MTKKLLYPLLMLAFIFSFVLGTPLFSQEGESEDIEDFSLEELLNVEITTAGKQAEKISEVPASVVVVTREDIEKYGYQNLGEILENIPGLYGMNDYSYKSVGVRGYWTVDPNRNLIVLVNDVKQTEGIFGGHILEQIAIPPEAIDRIEVVRGPMSVIYGTGAFFGVINIKTNVYNAKGKNNMVSFSYGSENTSKIFARAAGKSENFEYSFNGSFYDTDGVNADMELVNPAFTGQTTEGKLGKNQKFFNFSGTFKGLKFNASFLDSKNGTMFLLPPVGDNSYYHTRVTHLQVGYEHKLSEQVRAEAKVGYHFSRTYYNYDFILPALFGEQTIGNTGFNAELNLFYNPNDKLNLMFGVSYNKLNDFVDYIYLPLLSFNYYYSELKDGDSIDTRSIYAQLNYKFSEKFKIVAGARLEQMPEFDMQRKLGHFDPVNDPLFGTYSVNQVTYDQTDAKFIPRLALIYSPNDKNIIKLLYGQAINRPSFFQNIDLLNNPDSTTLLPEEIQTIELNYIGQLSSKFSVSVSLFRNFLDKLIFRSQFFVGGAYTEYYANTGEMTTNGVELTLNIRPSDQFYMELSGTYQDTKDKRDGLEDVDVGYSPNFLGYFKASYFFNKDISIALTGNYVGKMEAYYDATTEARLGKEVDAYFLLGANLRIRNLFGNGVFLNIRGSNLLDKDVLFPATSNNNLFATNGTVGSGLSFLVSLGWKFN